jgi:chromosome segregation ATPase
VIHLDKEILELLKLMRSDITSMKSDIGSLKNDVGSLKSDVGSLKSDVGSLKSDVGSLKSNVGLMQDDIKELKTGQNETNKRLYNIENKLDAIYDHTAELTEFRTETRDGLKSIKDDLTNVELITAKNYSDIVKLKAVK